MKEVLYQLIFVLHALVLEVGKTLVADVLDEADVLGVADVLVVPRPNAK